MSDLTLHRGRRAGYWYAGDTGLMICRDVKAKAQWQVIAVDWNANRWLTDSGLRDKSWTSRNGARRGVAAHLHLHPLQPIAILGSVRQPDGQHCSSDGRWILRRTTDRKERDCWTWTPHPDLPRAQRDQAEKMARYMEHRSRPALHAALRSCTRCNLMVGEARATS